MSGVGLFLQMAHRYDSRTTIFSPEGRLYQVEYAMESINHAGSCIGILAKDGVVLAAERKAPSKLLDTSSSYEKVFKLNDHIACAAAGITADANILVNNLRQWSERHFLKFQTPMPVESLVRTISDVKQSYTQFGGLRPFGVAFLFMGWDKHYGFQLYQSDPSGTYGGWKATCIGSNAQTAQSILKQEYAEDITLDDALLLAVKVLSKTMDSTSLTHERLEFATLTRVGDASVFTVLTADKVSAVLAKGEALRKAEDAAEKAKQDEQAKERKRKNIDLD